MNRSTRRGINRSLAFLLILTLLLSPQFPMTAAQARALVDDVRSLSLARERFARQVVSRMVAALRDHLEDAARPAPSRVETARERLDMASNEARPTEMIRQPDAPSLAIPPRLRRQADNMNFFNGPLQFTTMMENATKPACGCNGEPAYNQGISLVAQENPKCQSVGAFPGIAQDTGHATVFLHNGEFFLYQVDLEIKGRGFNWKFEQKYRDGINFEGPLGHNWEFNYNRRLFIDDSGDVIRMDGEGRADRYISKGTTYTAPAGFYTRLTKNTDGSFVERDKNGTMVFYSAPDNQQTPAAHPICHMTELRDRNGNRMQFKYNAAKQLIEVIDTLGRSIAYRYNTKGHLVEVEDFLGRKLKFQYDDESNTAQIGTRDLIAVTTPAITGTPNGNDFPEGKTTQYRYSSGFADEKFNHNLVEVIAPNEAATSGAPRVTVEYDNEANSPNADRVLHQVIGGINASDVAAGGTISYAYQSLGAASAGDFITPVFQTTITDRNGNLTEYRFNQLANIVRVREFTNRHIRRGDPEFFETRYEYNADGEMTRTTWPEGNAVENVYDEQNALRFAQGNLLSQTTRPDSKRGGDQAFIQTTKTYEPIYNRLSTATEPRGNDPAYVPQNGGATSAQRYTTVYIFDYQEGTNFAGLAQELGLSVAEVMQLLASNHIPMGLGDVNGDGRTDQISGNIIKVVHPTVTLLPDSNMAQLEGGTQQPIAELYQYNQFGQPTRRVDAEANVDRFDYHPENDPDGDGRDLTPGVGSGPFGYLKEMTKDAESNPARDTGTNPPPAQIRHRYLYDRAGNLINEVDGRGIATAYSVNQLNQVVEIRRAADVSQALTNPEEPNWNACTDATLIECRAGMVAFNYRTRIFYDRNNNVVERDVENRDSNNPELAGPFIEQHFVYDILDNLVEEQREASETPREMLITKYRRDRNENLVLTISPVANLPVGDAARQPANVVSTVFDERDLTFTSTRGGLTTQFRALLAHTDIAEIGLIPNSADISTNERHYDGNRNLTKMVDAADNTGDGLREATLHLFDGFDQLVSDIDAVGNQSLIRYDPAGNVVSESHYGPVGGRSPVSNAAATFSQPLRAETLHQPLLSQVELKYDEAGRMFEHDERLFDYRNQGVRYDHAPVLRDGPLGQANDGIVVTRYEFDRNRRKSFLVKDDLNTFRTVYDGVGRAIREIDPEGNEVSRTFDDDNNAVKIVEIEITQRQDVIAGNAPDLRETFTTINVFDALNRLVRTTDNIGQTRRYEYDSRNNRIHTSDAQYSASDADLIADALALFPMTGQSGNRINRPGNTMDYFVDGQNRQIGEVHQLRVDGQGKNAIDTSNPANPDGMIVIDRAWDANSRLVAMADDGSMPDDQNTNIGVIESVNPKGNVTRYVYDDLNRLAQEIFDDGTIKDYSYDGDDNAFCVVDQNGTTMTRTFDGINRLVQIDVARASSDTPHKANGFKDRSVKWKVVGTTRQTFEHDGLSRVTRSFDNNEPHDFLDDSIVTYAYDSLSRILEENQDESVVSSRWQGDDNREGLVYPDGREIILTFDRLNRIHTIDDAGLPMPGATLQQNPATSSPVTGQSGPMITYNYIGPDRVLERTDINGVRLSHLDDDRKQDIGYDRIKREVLRRHLVRNNTLVAGFEYGYDRTGNKFFEVEEHSQGIVRRDDHTYDSAHRLVRFSRQGEEADDWQLDGDGNWAAQRGVDNQINNMNEYITFGRRQGTTAGVPLQLASGRSYDSNGNLLDDGTNLYKYNFANQLCNVTRKADKAAIATYKYDAQGRKIKAIVTKSRSPSGGADLNDCVRYSYDGVQEIQETRANLTRQYVYGLWVDEPLSLRVQSSGDSVKDYFYHDDGKTNIAALTDESAAVVERYVHAPYGSPRILDANGNQLPVSAVGNPYMFTGRRLLAEAGLYDDRNRYLDPATGRFITRDPMGLVDGVNLYSYVGDNPINRVDPSGFGWSAGVVADLRICADLCSGDWRISGRLWAGAEYRYRWLSFGFSASISGDIKKGRSRYLKLFPHCGSGCIGPCPEGWWKVGFLADLDVTPDVEFGGLQCQLELFHDIPRKCAGTVEGSCYVNLFNYLSGGIQNVIKGALKTVGAEPEIGVFGSLSVDFCNRGSGATGTGAIGAQKAEICLGGYVEIGWGLKGKLPK